MAAQLLPSLALPNRAAQPLFQVVVVVNRFGVVRAVLLANRRQLRVWWMVGILCRQTKQIQV